MGLKRAASGTSFLKLKPNLVVASRNADGGDGHRQRPPSASGRMLLPEDLPRQVGQVCGPQFRGEGEREDGARGLPELLEPVRRRPRPAAPERP